MLESLLEELSLYQERMHRKSKKKFREYLKTKAEQANLEYSIFPNSFAAKNVVIGNLKKAKYVLGAHYDTPPRLPILFSKNLMLFQLFTVLIFGLVFGLSLVFDIPLYYPFIFYVLCMLYLYGIGIANKYNFNDNTSGVMTLLALMQKIKNDEVAYVFFDNEEKGIIGSSQLALLMKKKDKTYQPRNKIFINFDCVGIGDVFGIAYFSNTNKRIIDEVLGLNDSEFSFVRRKPSILEASDHFAFKMWKSMGIMCYNRKSNKLRLNNIHSHSDKYIELRNIEVLVNLITKYIDKDVENDG